MSRIALLKDNFLINFDDHCLYSDGNKIIELNKRPLDVLEYLCSYPNCYKKVEDINNYLEEGCLSATAIRGYIYSLRSYHPILREVITSTKSGYKYTGYKIVDSDVLEDEKRNISKDSVQEKKKEESDLLLLITSFIDESNLTTESDISFFEDAKKTTRILQLAQEIKGKLNGTNNFSEILTKLINKRVDSYIECVETCLCIRDCGSCLGQNILNEDVISNLHFLDCFVRYAKKQGYEIEKRQCINEPGSFVDLFIEVLKTPDGTKDFLDSIFYGPDKILLSMQEEKKRIVETFHRYMALEQ